MTNESNQEALTVKHELHCTAMFIAALAASLLVGCSDDHGDDPDAEACEHLEQGPPVAITAGADDATAAAISNDHKRYDVTLVDGATGKVGKVKLEAEHGDYILYFNTDVPAAFKALVTGAAVTPESSAKSSASCALVKAKYTVPFATAGTYVVDLGPTTATSVGIVVEEIAHDH